MKALTDSSDTIWQMGYAHIIANITSIAIVSPGPDVGIISSIPNAPAATRQNNRNAIWKGFIVCFFKPATPSCPMLP